MILFFGPFCKDRKIFALPLLGITLPLNCGVFFHLGFQKWKNLIMMIYCMLVRVFGPARTVPFIGLKKLDSDFFGQKKRWSKEDSSPFLDVEFK